MISDTPTPSTPSDDLADCRLATVLLRLEALERKYDSIESQLAGQVAENIMLRARCEILEGQVVNVNNFINNKTVSQDENKLASDIAGIDARVVILERSQIESGEGMDVERGAGTSSGVGGIKSCSKNSSSTAGVSSPVSESSHTKARAKREAEKRLVSEVVTEELGKISRNKRIVITGLPFDLDKSDEDVVKDFLVSHEITTAFQIFKKI
jgi:hypothetical protein